MAAGINGSTVLLQVRTAIGPDVFTTVGGQRGMSVGRERTAIDTSAKEDGDGTYIGGRRNSTVTMEGLVLASAAARTALVNAFESDGVGRIRRGAIGAEAAKQADVVIVGIDEDFPDDEESTWTVEFQLTGPWGPMTGPADVGTLLFGYEFWRAPAGALAQVDDISGNARHLIQADVAKQPVAAIAIDGLRAAAFDGVDDTMVTGAFALAVPMTLLAVVRRSTTATADAVFDGGAAEQLMIRGDAAQWRARGTGEIAVGPVNTNPTALLLSVDGASSRLRVGGGAGTAGTLAVASLTAFRVGAEGGAGTGSPFIGHILAAYAWSGVPSLANLNRLMADYLLPLAPSVPWTAAV